MARRRAKTSINPKDLVQLFLFLGILWLVAQLLQDLGQGFGSVTIRVAIGASVAVGIYLILRTVRRFITRHEILHKARDIVDEKRISLIRRRAQLLQKDAYGKVRTDRWKKEISYFVSHQLTPLLTPNQRKALARNYPAVEAAIEKHVESAARLQPAFQTFSDDMTPSEFEAFCAEELRQAGWDARVTLQSRDQGVDVVAERNHTRVVLQCKLYSRPVGNKSVQEVVAAKVHEGAHFGVVVSNNSYTLAAEQLAATNQVALLHYRDLRYLEDILSGRR